MAVLSACLMEPLRSEGGHADIVTVVTVDDETPPHTDGMRRPVPAYNRRQFLQGGLALAGASLLSGCAFFPASAPATAPTRLPRVGLLWRGGPVGNQKYIQAFRDGLGELGYVDGENIAIDQRFAEVREERLPALAAELGRLPVDIIVTGQVAVAQAATTTIPIVGVTLDSDPIGQGQIASFAHPGGNVTGLTANIPGEGGKRLELLKATVPGLARVAILKAVGSPPLRIDDVEDAARALHVELRIRDAALPGGLQTTFEAMVSGGDQAFMVPGTIVFLDERNRVRLAELAIQYRLPGSHSAESMRKMVVCSRMPANRPPSGSARRPMSTRS